MPLAEILLEGEDRRKGERNKRGEAGKREEEGGRSSTYIKAGVVGNVDEGFIPHFKCFTLIIA